MDSETIVKEIGAFERAPCTCSLDLTQKPKAMATPPCACCEERGILGSGRSGAPDRRFLSAGTVIIAAVALILTVVVMCLPKHLPFNNLADTVHISPSLHTSEFLPVEPDTQEAFWENLKGAEHCLRYATRQYTARLANAPPDVPAVKACRETPADIHGVEILPHFCRDLGLAGGVWGHWVVDFEEPACMTKWGHFIDRGCDDQGESAMTRRFEAHLKNMQHGDNWQIMCATTPADLKGFHFPTPTMCERSARNEALGVWEVDDLACAHSASQN